MVAARCCVMLLLSAACFVASHRARHRVTHRVVVLLVVVLRVAADGDGSAASPSPFYVLIHYDDRLGGLTKD